MSLEPVDVFLADDPEKCDNNGTSEQSETGPRANGIRPLDRINLVYEGSGPMAIMPTDDSSVTHPPDLFLSRMATLDGCPDACGNTEAPYRVETVPSGFVGYYGCESCGQFWNTAWGDR